MATELARQGYTNPKSSSFSIALAHHPSAGNTIIFTSGGGAISEPTGFTRVGDYGLGTQDVSIWYKISDGTETSLAITNNGGGDNTAGTVLQYAETLAPLTDSNNGRGVLPDRATDYHITVPEVVVTQQAVAIEVWSVTQSDPYTDGNRFLQIGPWGELVFSGAEQDPSGLGIIVGVGVTDLDPAQGYPFDAAAGHYTPASTYQKGATCFSCVAVFADSSGVPSVAPPANPVVRINRYPGMDQANWNFGTAGIDETINGFPVETSYLPGTTAEFCVDSSGETFELLIVRLGYNGYDNFTAINMIGSGGASIAGTVVTQPAPVVDDVVLGSTTCTAWTSNVSWDIPADAPSGLYVTIFRRTDTSGHASIGHFVVRETVVTDKITVVIPDLTHHAYNRWPYDGAGGFLGRSLYGAGPDGPNPNFAHRAYAVSLHRPYATQTDRAMTYIYDSEYPWILFAEMMGYNLTYLSDMDLENDPDLLIDARVVVILGHHEYWTANIFTAFQNADAARVNKWVVSSNTAGWQTRFDSADPGKRMAVSYKGGGTRDLGPGALGTGYDPGDTDGTPASTTTWRDSSPVNGVNNPDLRLDNRLTGQRFLASGPILSPQIFLDTVKDCPLFRASFAIQDLDPGETLIDISNSVGYEVDSADGAVGQPTNLVIITSTTLTVNTVTNAAGTTYTATAAIAATWSLHRTDAGGLTLNTGWRGMWSATREQGASPVADVSLDIQAAFAAAMYDLGATPATPLNVLRAGVDTSIPDVTAGAPGTGDPVDNDAVALAYGLTIPTTQTGAGSLDSEPAFGASGVTLRTGAATLSSTPALTASGTARSAAAATLAATPTLSATGTATGAATSSLSATGALSAAGMATVSAAATLSATPTLAALAVDVAAGASALSATPTLAALAVDVAAGAAALSSVPVLAASALRLVPSSNAALSSAPSLAASAVASSPGAGATLSTVPVLSALARVQAVSLSTLSSDPTLSATVMDVRLAAATLSSAPALSAAGVRDRFAGATLTATGLLAADAVRSPQGGAALSTTPVLTAIGLAILGGAAVLSSVSVVSASLADGTAHGTAVLSAVPVLSALAHSDQRVAALLESVPGFGGTGVRVRLGAAVLSSVPGLAALAGSGSDVAVHLVADPTLSSVAGAGPAGAALLTSTPLLVVSGLVIVARQRLAFDFQPAPPRWRFAVLTTGIRMLSIDRDSVDYVQLNSSVPPDVDAQSDTVEFAFVSVLSDTSHPISGDWHTGEWFTSATKLLARVLIGPGHLPLAPGDYRVWVRVTDDPEQPVQRAGQLSIT